MKKTVSINIGGIIFHIEEDGFEKLKSYLDSVNKYFSSFDDSKEIISDIESRIAEIFLSKLTDNRQTINIDDVNDLITTMGTTQDFDATLESEPEPVKEEPTEETSSKKEKKKTPKRLYRDTKRRIIGGVSAGIAHYFGIDPLWIRLLFIALFVNILFEGISGAIFLAYVILWIVLPYNNELEEDEKIKKLFRNPDDRVLGGVSSGIASYFGIDVSVVRLIFVLSIFLSFGATILVYIILWIITPEAKTITEKMQMEGEPVTLKNIEDAVKKNLRVKEGEEGPLVKILLFPFRLIALIIKALAKILGPLLRFLIDAVRIIFGAILCLDGFIVMVVVTGALLTIYGIGGMARLYNLGEVPIDLFRESIDPIIIFSIWGFVLITALGFFLAGLAIILKRKVVNAYVGWSLFALWIVSIVLISFNLPGYIAEFRSGSSYKEEKIYEVVANEIPTLKLSADPSFGPSLVELKIRGHADSVYKLVTDIESRGSNRTEAIENAKSIQYEVVKNGNEFLFDPKPVFSEGAKYRFQYVEAVFYVPLGQVFRMERDLDRILVNTLYTGGYRSHQMEDNDWIFDGRGIRCITCPVDESTMSDDEEVYGDRMSYPFEDFDEVKVASLMKVDIRRGSEYKVTVHGDEDVLDDVYLNQVGDELEVKYREDAWEWWNDEDREVKLSIVMPGLDYLELIGKCKGDVRGFNENEMEVNLVGASELILESRVNKLNITMAGASEMELRGSGDELDVEVIGASKLKAFDFDVQKASLQVVGASLAQVNVREDLEIEAAGMSKVRYRGEAKVSISEAGMSSVERD